MPKIDYFETPEGIEFEAKLKEMHANEKYKTNGSYSPKSELYENNLIPFVDKHKHYVRTHPQMNPDQYLANLQIVTRVR